MDNLRSELIEAIYWLNEQLSAHPYSDAGFTVAQHAGRIQRIDYHLTTKTKPTDRGGSYGPNKRS